MVTAIVIPIICIYFYWITKKEMHKQNSKWLQLENVSEEAVLVGIIEDLQEGKERYYYHRYIYKTEIKLKTDLKTIMTKKMAPLTKNYVPVSLKMGDKVKIYGNWKEDYFTISRIEKIDS